MAEFSNRISEELKEYTTFHALLVDDLRELLEEGLDDENRRWIHAVVSVLHSSLRREYAVEDQAGYLEEALERFPSWQHRIQELQKDRLELLSDVGKLQARIQESPSDDQDCRRLRKTFNEWVQRFARHKQQENLLFMDAMNLDVGEGE